jgi:hypothetical protein
MDQFGWVDMRDAEGGVFVNHEIGFQASATYHFFQLQEPGGAWRDANGRTVGRGWNPGEDERTLGHEVDVILTLDFPKPWWFQLGYGVFFPVKAGARIAGSAPQHFAFLWLVVDMPDPVAPGQRP